MPSSAPALTGTAPASIDILPDFEAVLADVRRQARDTVREGLLGDTPDTWLTAEPAALTALLLDLRRCGVPVDLDAPNGPVFPEIVCDLTGYSDNVFGPLGVIDQAVSRYLRHHGVPGSQITATIDHISAGVWNASGYAEALINLQRWTARTFPGTT